MRFRRQLVSDELAEWALESYAQLITECGLAERFHTLPLVLPTRNFFNAPTGKSHETAEAVFADVKRLMGVADDSYQLHRMPEKIEGVDHHNYQDIAQVAGTYQADEEAAIISYSPEAMSIPLNFIATLAHELAHDLLSPPKTMDDLPEHEMHTDFLCIVMGFGAFQAQGARQAGWAGYLSNELRMFALALFLKLRAISVEQVLAVLDSNLGKKLRRGIRQLETMPDAYQALEMAVGQD